MYSNRIPIKTQETLLKKEKAFHEKARRTNIWEFVGVSKPAWEAFKKSGYSGYVKEIEKANYFTNVTDLNFRYYSEIDYDTYHACNNGSSCCDGDYCRCGQITNARVTKAPSVSDFILKICDHIDSGPVSHYFFNRIYSIRKMYEPDSYTVSVGGGYYGQEIDGVKLDHPSLNKDLEFFFSRQNDLQAIQEYLLIEEYGYIHDRLKGKRFSLEEFALSEIETKADHHYEKIDVTYEIDVYNVLGVVIKEDKLSLMDGYHRVKMAKRQGLETGLFVLAS
jgi:hypothetical protein